MGQHLVGEEEEPYEKSQAGWKSGSVWREMQSQVGQIQDQPWRLAQGIWTLLFVISSTLYDL